MGPREDCTNAAPCRTLVGMSACRQTTQRLVLLLVALAAAVLVASPRAGAATITVQPGDSLGAIAARYGVDTMSLARANGIGNPHMIVAGRTLTVTTGSSGATGGSASASAGGYTVRPGDTLSAIAARHGVSVASLQRANGLGSAHMIVAGTRLRIPSGGSGGASPASAGGAGGHRVRPGENLSTIAARYGTTAQAIARANGISDPHRVIAGTRLRIPGGSPGAGGGSAVTAATHGWSGQASRADVAALMARHAARHGVDVSLVRAIGWQESGWWQGARSASGAIGVMQLMPGTAAWAGSALLGRPIDPYDVSDNIEAGTAYLGYLERQTGSRELAIAAYYQGLASVRQRGYYDDTKSYIASVSSFTGRV